MSIRLKQTLLLLAIALLPVLLSAWQSQRQMDRMAEEIAATARQQELSRERHYLQEKVADIGTSLRLIGNSTEDLLANQSRLLESVLAGATPTTRRPASAYPRRMPTPAPTPPSAR